MSAPSPPALPTVIDKSAHTSLMWPSIQIVWTVCDKVRSLWLVNIDGSALDQILAALTVKVNEVSFCEVASDAAISIEPENVIEVHFVLAGTLFVKTPVGCAEIPAGGIVAIPPGVFHQVAGAVGPDRIVKSADVFSVRPNGMFTLDAAGDEQAKVRVVCGHVRADVSGSFGALQGMKEPLCADLQGDPIIRAAFEAMLREVSSVELGSRTLIAALMKACLILALRRHATIHGIAKTLPGLFGQPSLARAVTTVLENPAAPHSLNSLAKESGMSRSKFAKVFVEMLGITPMEFVSRTRLTRGRELLLSTTLPISDIATTVGFSSRSYFSRAFKNTFNADPTTLRRNSAFGQGETPRLTID